MDFLFEKESEQSLEDALSLEWLETNGLGGYSSSTIPGCHTRKYHGLLVSKFNALPDKYVLLNKIDDIFVCGEKENFLTSHSYPDFLQDGSFPNLQEFQIATHPVWRYEFHGVTLTKEIIMPHEEDAILFKYSVEGDGDFKLRLRPLLSCRNFHALQHENSRLNCKCKVLSDGFSCRSYQDVPQLYFQASPKHEFLSKPLWYRNFVYAKEKERGYDFQEDLFSPGEVVFELNSKQEVIFSCSIVKQGEALSGKWQKELKRRTKTNFSKCKNIFQKQLHFEAQKFLTKKLGDASSISVVAGYHWFLDWGRDAMIALPGLTLYSGKENLCLQALKTFAGYEKKGLIPNFLGNTEEDSDYNSVDASLWFVWAVQQYYLKTKDVNAIGKNFWPTIKSIFKFYKQGTLHNIKMHDNGLLFAGSSENNLTWMDAVVDGKPVIPRYGYQVEINALWFNMLSFMMELADKFNDPVKSELKPLLPQIKKSFRQVFWCDDKGFLYDFVNDEQKNSDLRPNQIFAVSLPYSPLLLKMAVSVMSVVTEKLLTPYGLRTLDQGDSKYIGLYAGDQKQRDRAYHNGTVWPWLLGHFTEALLKTTSDKSKVLRIMTPCLEALHKHLLNYGVGSIAEIFSGDVPHNPDGCISQAWSVAEVLRLTYLLGK